MDFLIHHMLWTSARRLPDKEALVQGAERLTYEQVRQQVSGLAHGLQQAGVQRGERVGIYLEPSLAQALAIFAISQAGGVFVPINSLLFPNQVAHIVNDCGMKGIITTGPRLLSLREILNNFLPLEFAVLTEPEQAPELPIPSYSFAQFCGTSPDSWSDRTIEKDLAAILYTSGSTGKPKGVMLSHAQVMAGSTIVSAYLRITNADRILAILPFSFDAGLNQLMTAIQQGGTLTMMTFVFAKEIVEKMIEERVTGLAGVPTLWSLLAQPSSTLAWRRPPHLRYITNTGGAMPQSVLAALRQTLPGTQIFLMYGLTEAFRSTYLPPEELDRRPTSIGKAIANTEILVINELGQLCRPGEVGELVHRGPTVSMGYWGHPELTAQRLRPHPLLPRELGDSERVCYSGDLVTTDEEGFLYFVGRKDNMIKSSGYRISPTEVEEHLFQSGKVREAAVIGLPDEVLGQVIKAFVVPAEGQGVDPESLIAYCLERMPRYMVPKYVEVVEALPKTPTAKIDYPELRRREGL